MTPYRTTARLVGVLFIVGTIAGVLSLVFQLPATGDDYLTEVAANENQVAFGALLELVMGIALVGVAIAMLPVLRLYDERVAFGYVIARSIEAVFYAVDVLLLFALVTISRDAVDGTGDIANYRVLGDTIVALREWAFSAIVSAVPFGLSIFLLNVALYRARLIPRWLSLWGLVGGVPYVAAGVMVMFGLEPGGTTENLMDAPLAVQEMVFALWLIIKGFEPVSVTRESGSEAAFASIRT